jgi:hypothetical protein
MADKEQDWHFLLPVLDALTEIVYFRKSFPGLFPKILRKMAFLPVKDISHAIAAQPLEFQWPSKEQGTRIIERSNKPDLQLSCSSLSKEQFHVAPFIMLWGLPGIPRGFQNYYSLDGLIRFIAISLGFVVVLPSLLGFYIFIGLLLLLLFLVLPFVLFCSPRRILSRLPRWNDLFLSWLDFKSSPQIMYAWADNYEFNIDAVHHPAINAMLEYKWYAIFN